MPTEIKVQFSALAAAVAAFVASRVAEFATAQGAVLPEGGEEWVATTLLSLATGAVAWAGGYLKRSRTSRVSDAYKPGPARSANTG